MKINETIRKDGLRIITCFIPRKRSILVELVARVGFAYDPPDKPGLFHTFEHMAFKGTKTRTAKELSAFASRNFFGWNANTGVHGTTYQVEAIDRNLHQACAFLCDIYFHSIFPAAELKKEKGPILLEIAGIADRDLAAACDAANRSMYKDSPLRREQSEGGGTVSGITKIRRADLIEQKNRWHIPSNTIAMAFGSVRHLDFVREINRLVPMNTKRVPLKQWRDEVNDPPLKQRITVKRPKRNKSILFFVCKIPRDFDLRTREAFAFYSRLIGGDPSSMLWHEVRGRKGLAYIIQSAYSLKPGIGDEFTIMAETDPTKAAHVERLIWKVLARPLKDRRAFEVLKAKVVDAFEIHAHEDKGLYEYEGLIWKNIVEKRSVKEVMSLHTKRLKVLECLTLQDVEEVRKRFIHPERFVRVLVEPE